MTSSVFPEWLIFVLIFTFILPVKTHFVKQMFTFHLILPPFTQYFFLCTRKVPGDCLTLSFNHNFTKLQCYRLHLPYFDPVLLTYLSVKGVSILRKNEYVYYWLHHSALLSHIFHCMLLLPPLACNQACKSCTSLGPQGCTECSDGYHWENGICVRKFSEN